MDIAFTNEQKLFREKVAQWLSENVPSHARPFEGPESRAYDMEWQARQFADGWAGISWPSEFGGCGLGLVQQIIWYEEYARAHAPFIGVNFVGINHAGPTLIARGADAQKRKHLPMILRGEAVWCQGFSEPEAGSDLASLKTSARIEGDQLIINGQKVWTSYADRADFQELLVRTDSSGPAHAGITWVICDMHAPGVTVRPIRMLSGASDYCEVFYDDVSIPLTEIVGEMGKGWSVAMSTLSFERGTGFIGDQVKLAIEVEDLIKLAAERVDERGRRLISNEAIANKLALLRAEVAAVRAMTYASVSRLEAGEAPGPISSLIRVYMGEVEQRVHRVRMEVLGADGLRYAYGDKGPTFDYLLSYASTIAGGASQIQRNIIGERMLGLPKDR